MSSSEFNPSEAVTFDLAFGHIHLDGAPTRVMVPADALVSVCNAAGAEATAEMAGALGEAMGRRVAVRLAGGSDKRHEAVRAAGFETVVTELAGELALGGFGALSAERWGKAMVLVVDQSPLDEAGDELMAAILQAAMVALVGRALEVVVLQREAVRVRFLASSRAAANEMRTRLKRGEAWGQVLASMHTAGARA